MNGPVGTFDKKFISKLNIFEPETSALQGQRSTGLSYGPKIMILYEQKKVVTKSIVFIL